MIKAAQQTTIDFRLRLGEISVGSLSLRGIRYAHDFRKLDTYPAPPILPFAVFPPEIDAVQYASWPIEGKLDRWTNMEAAFVYVPRQYKRFFIDLSSTFTDYLAKFSSKSRSTLKRKLRRFREASGGVLDWAEFRTPDEILRFHDLARDVSRKTYQERLLKAGMPQGETFRQRLVAMSATDAVRGYILFGNKVPIAFLYCPVDDGVLIYDKVGYDPAWRDLSPGTVLLYAAIEKLFEESRFPLVDFTEGEGAHKQFFANRNVQCADILFVRKTLWNRGVLCSHASFAAASRCGVAISSRLGIKSWLKRSLRFGFRQS